ncbi:MAG: hypothetical protein DMG13_34605 [Acidobacteria bacterium]|nr:MAG: hypothetical protein DMG13_34605 [Acidobacteriota bacterium]
MTIRSSSGAMRNRLRQSAFNSTQPRLSGRGCARRRWNAFEPSARMKCSKASSKRSSEPGKRGSRMLEWTGERFLPWLAESTIGYEHLHRYRYAATLVTGKRVLDLASGEGYGSKILAETASSVVGVDIDENAICHATQRYGREALQFIIGSITAVPISENHSFDVIVCFEAIEHIEEQEKLLGEVKRLLKPDGVFIVSTPNKVAYQDISAEANPFHVKELDLDQFHQLLGRHFGNIRFLGQRIHPGSSIWPIGSNDSSVREFVMERGESEFRFIGNETRQRAAGSFQRLDP